MATFRLLHISDLHFSARPDTANVFLGARGLHAPDLALWRHFPNVTLFGPSSYSSALATHLALHIESVQDAVDALVVTGDIATSGDDMDLRTGRAFFFRDPLVPSVARISIAPDVPMIFLPGNHDRFRGRACLPAGRNFEKVFGASWDAGQEIVYHTLDKVQVVLLEKGGDHLAICTVDFSLKTRGDHDGQLGGWLGQGRAYEDVLDNLVEVTSFVKQRVPNVYPMWAMRFPPDMDNVSPRLRLIESEIIAPRARQNDVGLVLCGHIHDASIYSTPGTSGVRVLCAGSATSVDIDSLHTLLDIQISLSAGTLQSALVSKTYFDSERGSFLTDPSPMLRM